MISSFDDEISSLYYFIFPDPAVNQGNSWGREVMQSELLNKILGWLVGASEASEAPARKEALQLREEGGRLLSFTSSATNQRVKYM